MNLQNSIIFSLKESASERKTKSLLVIYANITANKIAIKLAVFFSTFYKLFKTKKLPKLTTVVKT